jgi:hypothetical protein
VDRRIRNNLGKILGEIWGSKLRSGIGVIVGEEMAFLDW